MPSPEQEVKTPRSVLLGAYTVRGCGVTKATFGNELLTGSHHLASISEELKNFRVHLSSSLCVRWHDSPS
eukprot:11174111-Prorocentrum_lima.AAC.1